MSKDLNLDYFAAQRWPKGRFNRRCLICAKICTQTYQPGSTAFIQMPSAANVAAVVFVSIFKLAYISKSVTLIFNVGDRATALHANF